MLSGLAVVGIIIFGVIGFTKKVAVRLYERHRDRIWRSYTLRYPEHELLMVEPYGGICSLDGGGGQWWHVLALVDAEPLITLYISGRFNPQRVQRYVWDVLTERGWFPCVVPECAPLKWR